MQAIGVRTLLAAGAAACAFLAAGQTSSIGSSATRPSQPSSARTAGVARQPSTLGQGHSTTPRPFGAAISGLTAEQLAAFEEGKEEFSSVEDIEGGLGPIFNGSSCAACHSAPVAGGFGTTLETRFGSTASGRFDPLAPLGGPLLQQLAIDPSLLEKVPAEANVVAQRLTTPLFGSGLIEAISDLTILGNARRSKPDGVRGRVAVVKDVVSRRIRAGRFGWKAQHASVLGFSADAYLNEMGVTNRFFAAENAPNGNQDLLAPFIDEVLDDAPDAATGRSEIDASADFIRLLAAPPQVRLSSAGVAGQRLFDAIKCTACHVPAMVSGRSPIRALSRRLVPLYSDLLLHDMGSLNDGIAQAGAKSNEMKTAPLWGLRARTRFLHDGRAATVNDAILAHDGEAAISRERYRQLSSEEISQLLAFLGSI